MFPRPLDGIVCPHPPRSVPSVRGDTPVLVLHGSPSRPRRLHEGARPPTKNLGSIVAPPKPAPAPAGVLLGDALPADHRCRCCGRRGEHGARPAPATRNRPLLSEDGGGGGGHRRRWARGEGGARIRSSEGGTIRCGGAEHQPAAPAGGSREEV